MMWGGDEYMSDAAVRVDKHDANEGTATVATRCVRERGPPRRRRGGSVRRGRGMAECFRRKCKMRRVQATRGYRYKAKV